MKIGRALERRAMRGMDAGVLLAAMLLLGAGATAARAATTLDLAPAADTFIQAGTEAGWDHGLDDHLRVDADTAALTYLSFDLSAVGAPVTRATLTLFCTDGSPDGGTLYPLGHSSWVEGDRTGKDAFSASGTGLKWNDVDENGDGSVDDHDRGGGDDSLVPDLARPIGALGSVVAGQAVTVDVTAAFQTGAGLYSLVIRSGSTNGASYASRENSIATERPRLHLELGDVPAVTTTTLPTSVPTTTIPPTVTTTTLPAPPKPSGPLHVLGASSGGCRVVAAVTGWSGAGAAVRCTDGDTCDADGAADASCMAPVTLCLESKSAGVCTADALAALKLSTDPRLQAVSAAFEDMKAHMPADASEACMAAVDLPVAKGRLALKMQRLGKGPRKTLALVCRPPRKTHTPRPKPGPRPPAGTTFATIQKQIFDASCATPTCHGAAAASGGLDLAPGSSYGNLVGVPAANPGAQAGGLLRVAPGNADSSFLLQKLLGNLTPAEGVRMPLVGRPPTPAQLDMIRRWIAAGAPETAPF